MFSVQISAWNDIKERLDDFPNVRNKYYWQTSTFSNEIKETDKEINFKREKLREINKELINPLLTRSDEIKSSLENGDYIDFESNFTEIEIKLDEKCRLDVKGLINICVEKGMLRSDNGNLNLVYTQDKFLNSRIQQIITCLNNYKNHFSELRSTIENLRSSNIPSSFENDIAVLIKDPDRKDQFVMDNRKKEFLFKLYSGAIIGNSLSVGHPWAIELRNNKLEELLDIIKKDPYSNEVLIRINSLRNATILDLKELSDELTSLYGEWQNNYHL